MLQPVLPTPRSPRFPILIKMTTQDFPLILRRSPRFIRPCPSSPPTLNAQTIRVLQFPHRSEQESAPRPAHIPVDGSQIILPREPLAGARVLSAEQRAAGEVRASKSDGMCAAFSFFLKPKCQATKGILKEWRWKQSGNKGTLVARAFLHIQNFTLSGRTICAAMSSTPETARFRRCS